jgi:hypothetical protein
VANDPASKLTRQVVQDASDVRWQVEELHCSLKHLNGSERLGKTLYQVHTDLFRDYLRAELALPHVRAL